MSTTLSEEQFPELFQRFHAALCDVAFQLVGTRAVAEELVQDLFFALWMQRDTLNIEQSMPAYLFGAVRNRAISAIRHQSTTDRTVESSAMGNSMEAPPGMSQCDVPMDEQFERAEQVRALRDAIESLPDRSQLAVKLRWEYQLSYAEVAHAMAISVKGVEKLLSIAMRRLRADLIPHITEHPGEMVK